MTINPAGSAYSHTYRSDAPPPAKLRVIRRLTPPPRGVCRNSGTPPPSRCSVLFGKPAAPPPAAGFFVFGTKDFPELKVVRVCSCSGSGADDSCLNFEGRDEVLSQTLRQSGRPGGSSLRFASQRCLAGDRESRFSPKRGEGESSSGRISPVDRSSLPFHGMLRSSPRPRLPGSASQSMKIVTIG